MFKDNVQVYGIILMFNDNVQMYVLSLQIKYMFNVIVWCYF
jgi:hypothetical protein